MRIWLGSLFAALLVAIPILVVYKPAAAQSTDRSEQLKKLQREFKEAAEKANKELESVRSSEAAQKIIIQLSKEYTPRIIELAQSDPTDKVAGDVLFWGLHNVPLDRTKVFDLLSDHWAKDARIKRFCVQMTQSPIDVSAKLLRKVAEENKDKNIQGFAYFALAKLKKTHSESESDVKAAQEAEKMFEKARKDYEDVDLPRGTIGDQSQTELEDIRQRGVGKKMPNLESQNLAGKKVQLKDYKGKVILLDIWATWCPPCRDMIPHERKLVEKFKDKPFALISVSVDEEKATLERFLKANKMPWTHWWNGADGGIVRELDVQMFPTIYVLDGEGVIRYKQVREKELEKAIEKLLGESEHTKK